MIAAEENDLHVLVLQILRSKKDLGRTEPALLNDVRLSGGFEIELAELQVQLRALGDKSWIVPMRSELAAKRWVIAPLGETKLLQAGL